MRPLYTANGWGATPKSRPISKIFHKQPAGFSARPSAMFGVPVGLPMGAFA